MGAGGGVARPGGGACPERRRTSRASLWQGRPGRGGARRGGKGKQSDGSQEGGHLCWTLRKGGRSPDKAEASRAEGTASAKVEEPSALEPWEAVEVMV